jgi:pimeloyl-ACP methyl ester carboxylesterase
MSEERGLMEKLKHLQDNCLNMLIQPERMRYEETDLGGPIQQLEGLFYIRSDFIVRNRQGLTLRCTYFDGSQRKSMRDSYREGLSMAQPDLGSSIVIYCHSQTGNRMEGYPLLSLCAKFRLNLLLFDFAGCGLSEGQYVSLGWFEPEDLKIIINHVKTNYKPHEIFLWGRSMGAVAALRYVSYNPNGCQALVLDSPFSDLLLLTKNIATRKLNLSSLLLSLPLLFISKRLTEIFGVNLLDLKPKNDISKITTPVYFITCKEDDLLPEGCVAEMYKVCPSKQKVITIEQGNHGSERLESTLLEAITFLDKHKCHESSNPYQFEKNIKAIFSRSTNSLSSLHNLDNVKATFHEKKAVNYDPFLTKSSRRGCSNSMLIRDSSRSAINNFNDNIKGSAESKFSQTSTYNPLKTSLDCSNRSLIVSNFSFVGTDNLENLPEESIHKLPPSLIKKQVGELKNIQKVTSKFSENLDITNRYSRPFHERRGNEIRVLEDPIKNNNQMRSSKSILNIEYGDCTRKEYNFEAFRKTSTSNSEFSNLIHEQNTAGVQDNTCRINNHKDRQLSLTRSQLISENKNQPPFVSSDLKNSILSNRTLRVLQFPHQRPPKEYQATPLLLQSQINKDSYSNPSQSLKITTEYSKEVLKPEAFEDSMRNRQRSPLMLSLGRSARDSSCSSNIISLGQTKIARTGEPFRLPNSNQGHLYRPFLDMKSDKENIRPNYL